MTIETIQNDEPAGDEWTNPNARIWKGLRLAVRTRLAAAFEHLLITGSLNRADLERIGEISTPSASADLRTMQERTDALTYDASAKCYRLKEEATHGR